MERMQWRSSERACAVCGLDEDEMRRRRGHEGEDERCRARFASPSLVWRGMRRGTPVRKRSVAARVIGSLLGTRRVLARWEGRNGRDGSHVHTTTRTAANQKKHAPPPTPLQEPALHPRTSCAATRATCRPTQPSARRTGVRGFTHAFDRRGRLCPRLPQPKTGQRISVPASKTTRREIREQLRLAVAVADEEGKAKLRARVAAHRERKKMLKDALPSAARGVVSAARSVATMFSPPRAKPLQTADDSSTATVSPNSTSPDSTSPEAEAPAPLPRSTSVPRSTWISPDLLTARIKDNVPPPSPPPSLLLQGPQKGPEGDRRGREGGRRGREGDEGGCQGGEGGCQGLGRSCGRACASAGPGRSLLRRTRREVEDICVRVVLPDTDGVFERACFPFRSEAASGSERELGRERRVDAWGGGGVSALLRPAARAPSSSERVMGTGRRGVLSEWVRCEAPAPLCLFASAVLRVCWSPLLRLQWVEWRTSRA